MLLVIVVTLIGLLIFALTKENTKAIRIGEIMFFAGLLAIMIALALGGWSFPHGVSFH